MTAKILKFVGDNRLESFGTLENVVLVPRTGEFINILNNRFKVVQVEWFTLNQEVFIYIEDIPVVNE